MSKQILDKTLDLLGNTLELGDGAAMGVSPVNKARIRYNNGAGQIEVSVSGGAYGALAGGGGGGSGTITSGSNGGNAGQGVYDGVTGPTLVFRNIAPASSKIAVALDAGNKNVTIDVTEANLTLSNLGGTLSIAKGGTGQTTASAAFAALSPLTTKGDLLAFSTTSARLPVGSNNQVLIADSAQTPGVKWGTLSIAGGGTGQVTASAAYSALSPMTTKGDIVAYSTAPSRLAVGTDGQVLTADAASTAGVKWATPTSGPSLPISIANGGTGQSAANAGFAALSPLTTKGDVIGYSTVPARLGVGANGQVLTADSTQATGLIWATPYTGPVLPLAIASGGTGQTTASAAFGALSPQTTKGDLVVYSTAPSRLAAGSDGQVLTADAASTAGVKWAAVSVSAAPVGATYITQTPDGTLTNEQALSLLATGVLKNTTTTGVLSIAVANTDYAHPSATYIVQTATSAPSGAQVLASLGTGLVKNTTTTGVLSIAAAGSDYENPLTFSTGLTRATNTVTNDLITGKSGGQTVTGGTANADNLTLTSNTGTKSLIKLGSSSAYDEVNKRLGIGHTTPNRDIEIYSDTTSVYVHLNANVSGNANAGIELYSGNGSASSAYVYYYGQTTASEWSAGLDNSSGTSKRFKITFGNNTPQNGTEIMSFSQASVPSGTSVALDTIRFPSITCTVTGTTHVTTANGLNYMALNAPTITDSSACTVDLSSTLFVSGPPIAGGSITLTEANAAYFKGRTRVDGAVVFNQPTATSGTPAQALTVTMSASTGVDPTTDFVDARINGSRTLTFNGSLYSAGSKPTVSTLKIDGATYAASTSAMHVLSARALTLTAPAAGTNVTLDESWAAYAEGGVRFGGTSFTGSTIPAPDIVVIDMDNATTGGITWRTWDGESSTFANAARAIIVSDGTFAFRMPTLGALTNLAGSSTWLSWNAVGLTTLWTMDGTLTVGTSIVIGTGGIECEYNSGMVRTHAQKRPVADGANPNVFWREDFLNVSNSAPYFYSNVLTVTIATGSANSGSYGEAPGVLQLVANGASGAAGAGNGYGVIKVTGTKRCFFEGEIQLPTLSDGTNTYTVWVGFSDTYNADPSNGIFFRYTDASTGAHWKAVTRASGTETATDTGIAVAANTTYHLYIDAGSTTVDFYINGSLVATNSTHIPTGLLGILAGGIVKSAGASNRQLLIDYASVWTNLTAAR